MNRARWRSWRVRCSLSTAVLRPGRSDGSGSTPYEHEQISVVGRGGSMGQTGTEKCTFGEALGKLHTPKCLAPMPSPSLSGGMDASTPLLPRYASRFSSTLPFVITPISTFFQIDLLLLFPFFLPHFSMLGFSPSCGSASFASPLGG